MQRSGGKITIKKVGGWGGVRKTTVNYSDLSQAEDPVQMGRDQCFQVTFLIYLFIFDRERDESKQHVPPRDTSIYVHAQFHT